MAPTVQSLSDIVAGIQSAQAPENAQIDSSISQNEQSGQNQVAGLNSAESNAFGTITQGAVNRGGYFSGFAPDAQAKYVGATYLPALAKLQSTIAATRSSLLGQKATLATNANTQGITEHNTQQGQLDAYNNAQAAAQATAAAAAQKNQATIQAAMIRAGATSSAAANKPLTAAEQKAQASAALQGDVVNAFNGFGTRQKGYTEKTILPTLINSYAGSGLTAGDITNAVYGTRKALGFG